MSLKICAGAYVVSNDRGFGLRRNYFPRIVTEAFLKSTIDGKIERSPDPVTMIEGDLTWHNNTPDPQVIEVQTHRGPRTIVAQSPSTVVIHDANSHRMGRNPAADFPSIIQDMAGARLQINRPSTARDKLLFGRVFLDQDDTTVTEELGVLAPGHSVHFRHLTAVQTPGVWTTASEFEPRWEAHARWVRLRMWARPVG